MQRTIDEILKSIREDMSNPFITVSDVENLTNVKELIETVATLQREKCAKEALLNLNYNQGEKITTENVYYSIHGEEITIDKESILNAKL